jgi:AcrR family transcriptional regulator
LVRDRGILSEMAPHKAAYHHGNLRRTLLDSAAEVIAENGPARMSLREVARRCEVSNAAPVHHFGDKAGLLTALAAEGFEMLAARLEAVSDSGADFVEVGAAYVGFAVDHRAHFEVMFRPELYYRNDPEIERGVRRSGSFLYGPASEVMGVDGPAAGIAAWSLMHGLATLLINGNLDEFVGPDITESSEGPEGDHVRRAAVAEELARQVGRLVGTPCE